MDLSDIMILIVLLTYTVLGIYRGLVATLVGLAVSIVAWVGSALIASVLAPDLPWGLTFLVCFLLVHIAGAVLTGVLDLAAKLPVLNFLNRALGGALGFLRGAVLLAVVCALLVNLGAIPRESVRSGGLLALFSSLVGFSSL